MADVKSILLTSDFSKQYENDSKENMHVDNRI